MGLLDNKSVKGIFGGGWKTPKKISSNIGVNHGFGGQAFAPSAPAPIGGSLGGIGGAALGATNWQPAPSYGGGMSTGHSISSGFSGGGGNAAPAPAPEPPRASFSMSDPNDKIAGVDSTFRDQEVAYNTALDKFVANLGKRRTSLETDSKRSRDGIQKNRTLGLTGLGEDFAARGMGHSGLYVDAAEKAKGAYQNQDDSVVSALADGNEELNFSETKERSDTSSRIQQAKRDALYRLQMNNNLVTGI